MSEQRSGSYLHGTAPEEQARLSTLNDLLNRAAMRELRLRGGEKIADFGAGLGQLSRDMARAAGRAVFAIERSPKQIVEAMRQAAEAGEETLLELRQGDVQEGVPRAEEGTFDVAHARFVLEHVPDPLVVVRAMMRSLRSGGRLVLQDDDHDVLRLWPEPLGIRPLWAAYMRAFDRLGNDPHVGRRLVELIHAAGGRATRTTWLFFGACAGEKTFAQLVDNMASLVAGAREAILTDGLLPAPTFDAALAELRRFRDCPDGAFWYAVSWAEGVRP
ncbi:MAG: class I SAM-dependent methyltransferase [Myxococcales bacterium]